MSATRAVPALRFPVEANLRMPGSKSHANRAIVCACLASGTTIIRNATPCDDVLVMVENLQKMGFDISWKHRERGELKIVGGIPSPTPNPSPRGGGERCGAVKQGFIPPSGEGLRMGVLLDCHNAGTALRFLLSVAALIPGEWILTGDEHMKKRPIGDLVAALQSLGAKITDTNGCPPIRIRGGNLSGSTVSLKANVSSQYLTSLLMIAPLLPQGLKIVLSGPLASEPYIDLTEKVMSDFGLKVERKSNTFFVQKSEYHAIQSYEIEGDWSAAGAWLVLNELTGSRITFPNLRSDSLQADRNLPELIRKLRVRGDLTIDCSAMPDQVMNLAVLAAFRDGKTTIIGAANLRRKECDRLAVIMTELRTTGINIAENEDGLVIAGKDRYPLPATHYPLNSHDDHRMAMCFAILGLKTGMISIDQPDCVQKSYPEFFDHLQSITSLSRPIAIVGMRGAGKSSLARRLAARLKLPYSDSDRVFEAEHGPIKEFIAKSGWARFREEEERLIAGLLKTGTVLSLGGGATESKLTRNLLRSKAIVLWVQATKGELLRRLESGKRPPITSLPLHEEVHTLLVERAPHYKEVATIMIPPKLRYSAQIPFAVKALRSLVYPSSR